ncbi:ATP-binding protein [Arthrobacter gandavensis]|uniref:histidine kinase n=1 Tax=Arthrobacter gandavensis TaxID=169960 RepID=A0ABN2P6T3_9MICC|nr:HAMP domain-containing sensor histidine kinase [Arthrobacter citreus]
MPSRAIDGAGIRRYRMTVRARLALTYSALLTGAGVVMMGIVYLVMRFIPTYDFASTAAEPAPGDSMVPPTDLASPPATSLEPAVPATPLEPANEILINSPEQLFNLLLWISAAVLVLLAVAGIAAGWIVAGRMLKPLQYINTAVHRAAAGDLGHRIDLVGPKDEISELAGNFDGMLEQLERSFTASQRFAQNASHELRTPLATTRAMLDVALAAPQSPEQQKLQERLRIMNERSIDIVSALLDLASIESSTVEPQAVDLATVGREVLASCEAEAAGRNIGVESRFDPSVVTGDPVLLHQLVANLIHNAIRHNIDGGFLTIGTRKDRVGAAVIEVTNSGPVLDTRTVAELTEPFRRGSGRTAHSVSGPRGHGLGLSIVQAIVERHHGTLALEPRAEGGLKVKVVIPA